jgi:hypothetical protein
MTALEIKIDSNSNLYINNYWITINKNNDLESILIETKFDDDLVKENKVRIVEKLDKNKKINRKLQAKLIDDEITKFIDNDEEVYDEDDESIQMISNYIYNPETKFINYHKEDTDEYNDEYNDEYIDEPYFEINGIASLSSNQLGMSLYEFYYFESDSLKYYTRIINDNPIYRISYYESTNQIKLNIIGESIKTFQIKTNKENSTFEFLKICINQTQNI